jgi:hypothetical protein
VVHLLRAAEERQAQIGSERSARLDRGGHQIRGPAIDVEAVIFEVQMLQGLHDRRPRARRVRGAMPAAVE